MKRAVSILLLCAMVAALVLMCGCATGPKVKVTFVLSNGEDDIVMEVTQGQPIKNAPTPTRRGCRLDSWYVNKKPWDLKNGKVEGEMTLYAKWVLADDAFDADPNAGKKSDGTDLRVCSFNVLKGELSPIGDRPRHFLDVLEAYQMDIVSVQEFDSHWKGGVQKLISGTHYSTLCDASHKINGIGTPDDIIYRNDKLTLIEAGCHKYETVNYYKSDFAWAIFETKDDAKHRFMVTSIHWCHDNQDIRNDQSAYMSEWIAQMKAKYDLPIISVGDYNEKENESPCESFLANCDMLDAKYDADRKGLIANSYHQHPRADSYTEDKLGTMLTIDHIFYTKELSALYYDTIIWEVALMTSDHNAVYADLKFN